MAPLVNEPVDPSAVPEKPAPTQPAGPSPELPPVVDTPFRRAAFKTMLFGPLLVAPIWLYLFPQGAVPHWFGTFAGLMVLIPALVAAVVDTLTRKIPNWLTFPWFLWGWIINIAAVVGSAALPADPGNAVYWLQAWPNAWGAIGMQECLWGSCFLFAFGFALWATTGGAAMGAGDVKYATALGAFLGVRAGGLCLLTAIVLQGLFSVGLLIRKHGLLATLNGLLQRMLRFGEPAAGDETIATLKIRLPMSAFFLVGMILVFCLHAKPAPDLPSRPVAAAAANPDTTATAAPESTTAPR